MGPNRPKRSQDEPKSTIKSPKVPKTCICKNLEKPLVFQGFWGPEGVDRAAVDRAVDDAAIFNILGAQGPRA